MDKKTIKLYEKEFGNEFVDLSTDEKGNKIFYKNNSNEVFYEDLKFKEDHSSQIKKYLKYKIDNNLLIEEYENYILIVDEKGDYIVHREDLELFLRKEKYDGSKEYQNKRNEVFVELLDVLSDLKKYQANEITKKQLFLNADKRTRKSDFTFHEFIEKYENSNMESELNHLFTGKDIPKIKLLTSNQNKLKEFKELFKNDDLAIYKDNEQPEIEIATGKDIKEIQGERIDVILHKVLDDSVESYSMVEDTILTIYNKETKSNEEIVDIKYVLNDLLENNDKYDLSKTQWTTTLALKTKEKVLVYTGIIYGKIVPKKYIENTFGFDSVFVPYDGVKMYTNKNDKYDYGMKKNSEEKTLKELDDVGEKKYFSARAKACQCLLNNELEQELELTELKAEIKKLEKKNKLVYQK
jgi:inosine/xanthosine triphosphate pyrophosphatase family protein